MSSPGTGRPSADTDNVASRGDTRTHTASHSSAPAKDSTPCGEAPLDVASQKGPPKNARFAWFTVFLLVVLTACRAPILANGVFLKPVGKEFNRGRGDVAWIGSVTFFMAYAAGLPIGSAVKRFGPKPLVAFAGFLFLTGGCVASVSPNFEMLFFFQSVMFGVAVPSAGLAAVACVLTWFDKHQALAIALGYMGQATANFSGPLIAVHLMDSGTDFEGNPGNDWRFALRCLSIGCGCIVVVCACFLKFHPQTAEKTSKSNTMTAIKSKLFIYFVCFNALCSFAIWVPIIHLAPYAEDQGVTKESAALMISILGGCQIAGSLAFGFIADRFGPVRPMVGATMILGLITGVRSFAFTSYPAIVFFSVVYGFNSGAFSPLNAHIAGKYFPDQNPAPILGAAYTFTALPTLCGPVIAGYIFDWLKSYLVADIAFGVCLFGCGFFLIAMVHLSDKSKPVQEQGDDPATAVKPEP